MKHFMLGAAAVLGLALLPQPGHSEEKGGVETRAPVSSTLTRDEQATRSNAMARDARSKAEVLERDRDRKMREISKGICTGC